MLQPIQHVSFFKHKYGREILIDTSLISETKNYILTEERHTLDFYEIIFLTKGSGHFFVDEERIAILPETIIFTSPYQFRQWKIKTATDGHILTFDGSFIHSFFNDPLFLYKFQFFHATSAPHFVRLNKTQFHYMKDLLTNVGNEILHYRNSSEHILRAYLYLVIGLLNREFEKACGLTPTDATSLPLFLFRQMMETKLYEYTTVREYAKELRLSVTTLNKVCRKFTNQTSVALLEQRKLLEAKRLLCHSGVTAAEVAYKLNFSSPANFSRFFFRLTGNSPGIYRQGY